MGIGVCRVQQWWVKKKEREKVIRKRTITVGLKGDLEDLNRRFSRFGTLVNSQYSSSLTLMPQVLFSSRAYFVLLLVFFSRFQTHAIGLCIRLLCVIKNIYYQKIKN